MSKLKNENDKNFGEITLMGCPNFLHREIISKEEMSDILAKQGVVLKIDKNK